MTPMEAAMLCRFTKAACPQQAIDDYTPDAWHPLLADLRFEDAKAAVIEAARVSPFVAPAEIRAHVKRIRRGRLDAFGPLPDPPANLNNLEQKCWLDTVRRSIANGEHVDQVPPPQIADPAHVARMRELLAGGMPRSVDDALKDSGSPS